MASSTSSPAVIAIFWDMESCQIPLSVDPTSVAARIKSGLQNHPLVQGSLIKFNAYGCTQTLNHALANSGVTLVHVPSGSKNAIIVDMMSFSCDYDHKEATIMVITGNDYFSSTLSKLRNHCYTILLAVPDTAPIDLTDTALLVWDWPQLARGKGCVISSTVASSDLSLVTLKHHLLMLMRSKGGNIRLDGVCMAYKEAYGRDFRFPNSDFVEPEELISAMDDMIGLNETGILYLKSPFI